MFFASALRALEESGAAYCVVGGLAVSLSGVPRTTYDLDVVVVPDADTLARVDTALRGLGLVLRQPLDLASLADADVRSNLLERSSLRAVTFGDPRDPLREVDVLVSPPLDPRGIVERARRVAVGGLTTRVACVEDLVAMKLAAGRPQDLADAAHLRRLIGQR